METVKKIAAVILEIALFLAFCFGIIYFLFPDILGKKKKDEESLVRTEQTVMVTTEAVATATSAEAATEDSVVTVTEAATEAVTEATTEATTEAASEKTSEEKTEEKTEKAADSDESKDADKEPPIFLIANTSPQVAVGDEFDIHDFVGYADNLDRKVTIFVDGDVDTSKTGTYKIEVSLTDDAKNETKKSFEVEVVESAGDISSGGESVSGSGEKFSDFIKKYKTDKTSVGIDISRWQEDVDFQQVKEAGCEFVYMRIGGCDKGQYFTDRYYKQNMERAKAAGLKVGVYWYSEDGSIEDVEKSVAYLTEVLDDEELDLPIAYDWEDFLGFENYKMNLQDINQNFEVFANKLESCGYTVCLYSSKNFLENVWTNDEDHPIWLAHYTDSTSYKGEYFMWQHSSTGNIPGINGYVDLDILYK